MKYTWGEAKQQANQDKHGLDFADAEKVFNGPFYLFEDRREDYEEQRMIALGMLGQQVILIVHIEEDDEIRIISMRKAEKYETDLFYENVGF